TAYERELQAALQESQAREHRQKTMVFDMQATVVLQGLYVDRVHEANQTQSEQAVKKKKLRLNADGLPKLLDGAEFFARVEEHTQKLEQDKEAKERKRDERTRLQKAVGAWTEEERARKGRNEVRREEYREQVTAWE
ncbi:hypothetical protein K466DRAFT_467854, partial [Polyporus arcularius HHB13444]